MFVILSKSVQFGEDDHAFGGPGGLFAQLAQCVEQRHALDHSSHIPNRGFAGGMGPRMPRPANLYDTYFKAYSVAMLPGKERENVSYGGKSLCI